MPASINKFREPDYYEHRFEEHNNGNKVGTLRVKPSSILWKPKGAHQFHSVSLADFEQWMLTKKQVAK
jgi:hypothetical protein